jgi:CRP/FNR family cyclic AMP-dependent transcriptional regulator
MRSAAAGQPGANTVHYQHTTRGDGVMQRDIGESVRSVPLFRELSDRELGEVVQVAKRVEYPAGATVANEGEPGLGFHLILEGNAEVSVGGASRGVLGPGDYFGEISLLDGGPRSATVATTTPMQTLSIVSWDFGPLLDRHPAMTKKLLLGLCEIIREARLKERQGGA